jgi:MFS family permease
MEKDLGLKGNQYQTAVSLVFVTYVLFETPSNMVLKKFTPRIWIALIATLWGIIATLTGLCNNYGQLIACRLLLGAVEAGLFPGLTIYLTFFYTKKELGMRVGFLLVSAAIAGALGGLLAFAIGSMDGISGLHGWRWIMIIEGLPSFVLGIVTFFALPNDPDTAYFLDAGDRALVQARRDAEYGQTASAQGFNRKDALKGFKDWKVWLISTGQFGIDTMLYGTVSDFTIVIIYMADFFILGFSAFLPTIINGLGHWTSAQVQLLTIPCYVTGIISYLTIAFLSDRHAKRGVYAISMACVSVIGYGILISNSSAGVHYFGCFLVAAGLYVCVGIPLAWLPNNCPRYGKRAVASGIQLTLGNCAGIMAPFIYPTNQGPRYVEGHAITLSMVGYAGLVYSFFWWYFRRQNQRRDTGLEDWKTEGKGDEELMEMGDESPRYRYTV